mmetsp:Transcript_48406/g.149544  ORF Transcript_48406/g.149544 Transcript_48406/m.149544 type:complete len:238 (-) Transcript_48406:62-775(-)
MAKAARKSSAGGGKGGKRKAVPDSRRAAPRPLGGGRAKAGGESITETAKPLSDSTVAGALSEVLPCPAGALRRLMRQWEKPILKARIPGLAGRVPTDGMLEAAKRAVLRFYAREAELGDQSDVAKAFYLASGEVSLRFDWEPAMARVRRAKFDLRQQIDRWDECLAMTSGDTNSLSEIYVCGTKKITQRALTSLICHEGLHNLARRTRQGNSFLSEDLEHMAMALIGDPQLVHELDD